MHFSQPIFLCLTLSLYTMLVISSTSLFMKLYTKCTFYFCSIYPSLHLHPVNLFLYMSGRETPAYQARASLPLALPVHRTDSYSSVEAVTSSFASVSSISSVTGASSNPSKSSKESSSSSFTSVFSLMLR